MSSMNKTDDAGKRNGDDRTQTDVDFAVYLRSRIKTWGWSWLAVASPPLYRLVLLLKDGKTDVGFLDGWLLLLLQGGLCFLLAVAVPNGRARGDTGDAATDERPQHGKKLRNPKLVTIESALVRASGVWRALFYSWSAYYLCNAAFAYCRASGADVVQLIGICINTVPVLFLFFSYLELTTVTVDSGEPRDAALVKGSRRLRGAAIAIVILLWIAVWSVAIGIWNGLTDDEAKNEMQRMIRLMGTIGGLLNSVGLSMLIGRLSSPRINPGVLTLAALFLYAAIQPLAAGFVDYDVMILLTTIAMPLKVLLFLVLRWVLTSGRLADFMWIVRPSLDPQAWQRPKA